MYKEKKKTRKEVSKKKISNKIIKVTKQITNHNSSTSLLVFSGNYTQKQIAVQRLVTAIV